MQILQNLLHPERYINIYDTGSFKHEVLIVF